MKKRTRTRKSQKKGFTLMEVLLVMAILVILGSLVVVNFTNIFGNSQVQKATIELAAIKTALSTYYLHVGSYPSQQDGLSALESPPANLANPRKWAGPYIDGGTVPMDPWNQPYQYNIGVAANGISQQVSISSMGPDMQANSADDITVTFGG